MEVDEQLHLELQRRFALLQQQAKVADDVERKRILADAKQLTREMHDAIQSRLMRANAFYDKTEFRNG